MLFALLTSAPLWFCGAGGTEGKKPSGTGCTHSFRTVHGFPRAGSLKSGSAGPCHRPRGVPLVGTHHTWALAVGFPGAWGLEEGKLVLLRCNSHTVTFTPFSESVLATHVVLQPPPHWGHRTVRHPTAPSFLRLSHHPPGRSSHLPVFCP